MATIEQRKSGDKITFRAKIRIKGFPTQSATFSRKTDAKRWAEKTETAIRENRFFDNTYSKNKTFSDLIERYFNEILPSKGNSTSNIRNYLEWWKSQLGDYYLADISTSLGSVDINIIVN